MVARLERLRSAVVIACGRIESADPEMLDGQAQISAAVQELRSALDASLSDVDGSPLDQAMSDRTAPRRA